MEYDISGEIAQNVRLDFGEGDAAWASRGSFMAYSTTLKWRMRIPGGVGGAARRMLAGENVTLVYMEPGQAGDYALLAANQPGKIITWDLKTEGAVIATRGAFLAAWGQQIDITVTIARRAGAAFFGGAGLFLQRVSGDGVALIHGSGDFSEHQLAAGESMLVSTGNLAAFSADIDYSVQGVGGCSRIFFGGEGLFMTRMTGPGRVLLQTLKRTALAKAQTAAASKG